MIRDKDMILVRTKHTVLFRDEGVSQCMSELKPSLGIKPVVVLLLRSGWVGDQVDFVPASCDTMEIGFDEDALRRLSVAGICREIIFDGVASDGKTVVLEVCVSALRPGCAAQISRHYEIVVVVWLAHTPLLENGL
jgi:hypothetical protein